VPIIALTANAFAEDIDKTRAAGMNMHLTKPIEVDEMRATLRRFLAPGPDPAASESDPMGGAASRRV
jgi:CheY-like chemotaxis protein